MKAHQEAVIDLFGGLRPGHALDAGSGGGPIGRELAEMGFHIFSLDRFGAPGREGRSVVADLDAALPFADRAFEYVVLSETLQHLDNHAALFDEFSRLLVPGGTLVISMPNALDASSRLSFLIKGYFPAFKPVRSVDPAKPWDSAAYNVVSLVDVLALAAKSSFELVAVSASGLKRSAAPLYPLLKALYYAGLAFERDRAKTGLLRTLSSREALRGEHLILRLRRAAGAAGATGTGETAGRDA